MALGGTAVGHFQHTIGQQWLLNNHERRVFVSGGGVWLHLPGVPRGGCRFSSQQGSVGMVGPLHGVCGGVITSVYPLVHFPQPKQYSPVAGDSSPGNVAVAPAIAGLLSSLLFLCFLPAIDSPGWPYPVGSACWNPLYGVG